MSEGLLEALLTDQGAWPGSGRGGNVFQRGGRGQVPKTGHRRRECGGKEE